MTEASTAAIAYIDGPRLHRALVVGIQKVVSRKDYINKINVFPVPDADTGTNLALTLNAIVSGASARLPDDIGKTLARIADSALDGARGNSGAIFAQFLQGLCDGASGQAVLTPKAFAAAVKVGSESAAEAIAEPRQGTMLSVIQDYALELSEQLQHGVRDIRQLLANGLDRARRSLERTPEQLEVLRQAGVVDAGAQGFVYLLEGIQEFIEKGSLRDVSAVAPAELEDELDKAAGEVTDLSFRFCTECLISGDGIDRRRVRESLQGLDGNSMVLAGSKHKVRVHMHVNEPAALFERCATFGEVSRQKADDMSLQQYQTHRETRGVAIVTDSAADIPEEELEHLDIHMVPLRIHFGERQYLDRVTLSPPEFYQTLRDTDAYPRTSQPPPGDFRRQYEFLESHFESIVSIHISGQLSGTLQGATSAAGRVESAGVRTFDSRNASAGQGLLTMYAAEASRAGLNADEVVRVLEQARSQTRTYGAIEDLSYGVRGGRIPAAFKRLADFLRLRPVVAANGEGRIVSKGIMFGRSNMPQKFARSVAKHIDPQKSYRLLVGHCDDESAGQRLREALLALVPNVHSHYLTVAGTAFGVHAGPGTLVVGVQEYKSPEAALESLKQADGSGG